MKTQEQVVKEIKELLGDKIILDRFEYFGVNKKSIFGCNAGKDHGYWEVTPNRILSGHSCRKCGFDKISEANTKSKTEVVREIKEKFGDKILLDKFEYSGSSKKVCVGCKEHGYWFITPYTLMISNGCSRCNGHYKRAYSDAKKDIIKAHGNSILLDMFEYTGDGIKEKAWFGCGLNETHPYWQTRISDVLRGGGGCRECDGTNTKTTEDRIQQITKIHGDRILLDKFKYVRAKDKCTFGCGLNKEHPYWNTRIDAIIDGHGCPACNTSKGEVRMEDFFKSNKVNFLRRHSPKDCKNPRTNHVLEFDFYMQKLNIFMEFDGIQHFKATDFGSKGKDIFKEFEECKYKDFLKNEFCRLKKQHLLRIHYKDFKKIEEILLQVFEILSNNEYDKTKNSTVKLFNSTLFLNVV